MQPQSTVHIICVGAVYIDTIWTVANFPNEHTKTRAENVQKRRGGNVGNTLEVLSDIVKHIIMDPSVDAVTTLPRTRLYLLASLPVSDSADFTMVQDSLPDVNILNTSTANCKYAASSTIIRARDKGTRTIISHGSDLPEMTASDFKTNTHRWNPAVNGDAAYGGPRARWIHFEGRNAATTTDCISHLRNLHSTEGDFKISVECENPERERMMEAAQLADVVFFSQLWATKKGFRDARTFLLHVMSQQNYMFDRDQVLLVCTWGADGATAMLVDTADPPRIREEAAVSAWVPYDQTRGVVDSIGAGDTFIAGRLFKLTNHADDSLQDKLSFAVQVAGTKVYRDGFAGLGAEMMSRSLR